MEAYDKWRAARRDLRASIELPGGGDFGLPETKAAQRRKAAALETMLACRPQTLHDAQGLAHVAWEYFKPSMPEGSPEFEAAMCDPGLRLVLRLWQSAAGMSGLRPKPDKGNTPPSISYTRKPKGAGVKFGRAKPLVHLCPRDFSFFHFED
ncbi:hypothetical protein [Antarctobacter heliothermus]|nr:hypothetical protein [Antarctobacter heliothermus]